MKVLKIEPLGNSKRADFAECEALERAKARSSEDKLSENDSESEMLVRVKQNPKERILRRMKR